MDGYAIDAILQNHINPLMVDFGLDRKTNAIWDDSAQIKVEAVWTEGIQMKFVDALAQSLGSKGYELDIWMDGKNVCIAEKE